MQASIFESCECGYGRKHIWISDFLFHFREKSEKRTLNPAMSPSVSSSGVARVPPTSHVGPIQSIRGNHTAGEHVSPVTGELASCTEETGTFCNLSLSFPCRLTGCSCLLSYKRLRTLALNPRLHSFYFSALYSVKCCFMGISCSDCNCLDNVFRSSSSCVPWVTRRSSPLPLS